MDTEGKDNQIHCESDSARLLLDTDVDMLLTVSSQEGSVHDDEKETDRGQEDEIMSLEGSQCHLVGEDLGNCVSPDDLFHGTSSEMKSVQVLEHCNDTSVAVSLAGVSDVQSVSNDSAVIDGIESDPAHHADEYEVLPADDILPIQVVQHHDNASEMCTQAALSAGPQPFICSDNVLDTDSVLRESFPSYVVGVQNECFVTDVAEVEIQDDNTDAREETGDSDCVIQDALSCEDYDCWPAESEHETSFDLLHNDHTYHLPAESIWHDPVKTSSNDICHERTSQAGVNLSAPSMLAHDFNVNTDTILPFPSLIVDPDELYCNKQSQNDNAPLVEVPAVQLMDTETSVVSDIGCLVSDNSSYPVVEIVPRNEEEEVEHLEQSVVSYQVPNTTNAGAVSDNTSSGSTMTSSSRRAKASTLN